MKETLEEQKKPEEPEKLKKPEKSGKKEKPVEDETQEDEKDEKLEILNTRDENFNKARRREFSSADFDQYLIQLREQGILKLTKSPSRIKWLERREYAVKPIGEQEGAYQYGAKSRIETGYEGDIFKSLSELREIVIANEQTGREKKKSKERPSQDTELLKHFEQLMAEPLKMLAVLEKRVTQEPESIRSPLKLLRDSAHQLEYIIRKKDYEEARTRVNYLEDIGVENPGNFNKDIFENTILVEAQKYNLIEKPLENTFKNTEKAQEFLKKLDKRQNLYYWHNERDPEKGRFIRIDVYAFKGDKKSGIQNYIFENLQSCANIVESIDSIKSSMDKLGEKTRGQKEEFTSGGKRIQRSVEEMPKAQRDAQKRQAEKAIQRFLPREEEEKPPKKKKKRRKKTPTTTQKRFGTRFTLDELDELKKRLEEKVRSSRKKKTTTAKKTE